jgi:hypothetical protein
MVATSASAWLDALELHANEPGTDDIVLPFVKRGEVSDDGTLRPTPPHRVVLRRQVMQVEDIGPIASSGTKHWLPNRRQMLDQTGRHRRQHHVRGVLTVLVRGMDRHCSTDRAPADRERPYRVGVVEMVHCRASKERRRMGVVPQRSERPGRQFHRPIGSHQRHRQVPHHLCRPTTREEQQPHHHMSPNHPGQPTSDADIGPPCRSRQLVSFPRRRREMIPCGAVRMVELPR